MSELEDTDADTPLPPSARKRARFQKSDHESEEEPAAAAHRPRRRASRAAQQHLQEARRHADRNLLEDASSESASREAPGGELLSDDEDDAAVSPAEATPKRQSRRLSAPGRTAVNSRAAAAGEAFRRRLNKRKPPPSAEAVAAARAAQRANRPDTAANRSDLETSYESEPPIQGFIASSEPESGSDGDQHPGAAFEGDGGALYRNTDSEAEEAAEEAEFRSRLRHSRGRKRKAGKHRRAGASLAEPATHGASPSASRAAAAATAVAASAATASGQPAAIFVLSDDEEDAPLLRSPAARHNAQRPDAATAAASSSDDDDVETAAGAGLGYSTPRKRLRKLDAGAAAGYVTPPPGSRLRSPADALQYDEPARRQGTLDGFFTPVAASAPAKELEDSDVEERPAPPDDDAGSLEDFIDEDESSSGEEGEEESDAAVEDPIPAALRELRRALDRDMDNHLADQFANFACGLLLKFMDVEMDGMLEELWREARYRIKSELEQGSKEVSGGLGWVNAERNGVIDAMRRLTRCTTGWDFGGGVTPDAYTEDDRDGRFTCEVCGRSQGSMKPITLRQPCSREPLSLAVHTLSPQKPRRKKRRRRGSDDDQSSEGDDPRNVMRFWVGSDCVQRMMLGQLLQHWTCMFADKYCAACRSAIMAAQLQPERALDIAAKELKDRQAFLIRWFGHMRRALGLGKKMQTMPRQKGFAFNTGTEAIILKNEFDE